MRTSSLGEFEFKDLDPGNYTFIVEARYIISDETDIDLNDDDSDGDDTQTNTTLKTTTPKQTQGATFGEKVNAGLATSSFNSLLTTLTELDTQLQNDAVSTKTGISTSRSNLRRVSNSIAAINTDLQNGNTAAAQLKMQTLQTQFMDLQASLNSLGASYSSISNVLKTKHDTAKNSVGNIR
jgi:hypothetical protein